MSHDKRTVTKTNDGYVVELFAKEKINNETIEIIDGISILEAVKNLGEEEQYENYKKIIDKIEDRPAIIKLPEIEQEEQILKANIRATLRIAKEADVSILCPKISIINDLNKYKEIVEECKNELEEENTPYKKHIKIGAVIEIPSAALMSYGIARECDFLFIDINSLTNYTFGGVKNKELYRDFQPGVIKLVQQAKQGAHDAGIYCGICGEVVDNYLYTPLLIGLGLDQFSMNSENILNAKKIISELDKSECKYFAKEILELRTIEDIEEKLRQFTQN